MNAREINKKSQIWRRDMQNIYLAKNLCPEYIKISYSKNDPMQKA